MLTDELVGCIPGYQIESTGQEDGDVVLTLLNEVNGKRFTIGAKRIEQLMGGTGSLGSRLHEELTLLAAGMPVKGIRQIEGRFVSGKHTP